MFYLNGHEKRRDIYVALTDMVCFIFQNDVEFTALAEEKAALIRLRESIIFFLVGSERRNSRKFYWNCHGYGFYNLAENREKGYKVQIFRRNPFDNSTNRIVDKWNE